MDRRMFSILPAVIFLLMLSSGCTTHNAAMTFHENPPGAGAGAIDPESIQSVVVYDSWSGNTRQIAGEIAETLACPVIPVEETENCLFLEYDLIVVGSPVHGGMPTDGIEDFLSGLEPVKASAVFVTYGAPLFGSATASRCLNSMEEKLNGTCIGRFKCNGFHKILCTYPSHPDEADKSEAAKFAAGLLERIIIDEMEAGETTRK